MLQYSSRRIGGGTGLLGVLSSVGKEIVDVLFAEPDGTSSDSDAVVGEATGFDKLIDTRGTDGEPFGNLFDGEQHERVSV